MLAIGLMIPHPGGAALSIVCELVQHGWLPENWSDHFHAPFDFGRYKQGDVVPWQFKFLNCPLFTLAMLANAQPGSDELFSVLAGAVTFSEYVERVRPSATKLTAHCGVSIYLHVHVESEEMPWHT